MPARPPETTQAAAEMLVDLGQQILMQRKALRVNATATAEAAGISRVTLHRIEKGEPAVTIGAYLNVMAAIGLKLGIATSDTIAKVDDMKDLIPVRIALTEYPQLRQLAWQVHTDTLTPAEALGIYERNARHLDMAAMEPRERYLFDALHTALGKAGREA